MTVRWTASATDAALLDEEELSQECDDHNDALRYSVGEITGKENADNEDALAKSVLPPPLRFVPASVPAPEVRARKITDVSMYALGEYFPDSEHGDVIRVTLDGSVPEGFVQVVYSVPIVIKG